MNTTGPRNTARGRRHQGSSSCAWRSSETRTVPSGHLQQRNSPKRKRSTFLILRNLSRAQEAGADAEPRKSWEPPASKRRKKLPRRTQRMNHTCARAGKAHVARASDRQIAALQQAEQINPNLVVPAPISGVVLTRSANWAWWSTPLRNSSPLLTSPRCGSWPASMRKISHRFASGSAANVTAPAYPGRFGRAASLHPTASGLDDTHGPGPHRGCEPR